MKKINLILGIISIIIGLSIFVVSYSNYLKVQNFYTNASKVEGYVYAVRKIKEDTYSFEYKYVVNKTEYKSYVSEYKIKKLKDLDNITVYYDEENPNENITRKPDLRTIIPSIVLMVILSFIGLFNIIRIAKKSRA